MGGSTYPRIKDDERTRPLGQVARGPKLWITKGSWLRGEVPFLFLILGPEEREFNLKKRADEGDLDFYQRKC